MKKKVILLSCLVLVAVLYFLYPVMKLWVISDHYHWYGTYIISPEKFNEIRGEGALEPIQLQTVDETYTQEGIQITNILYFEKLKQLSFGYIYDDDKFHRYAIEVTDGTEMDIGTMRTTGSVEFYSRSLEKLYFDFNEELQKDHTYTVVITDLEGNQVGTVTFVYQ